jgi:excinuclease ABC subunit B
MYADRVTDAMDQAIHETDRRRAIQIEYNRKHDITPETIRRAILDISPASGQSDYYAVPKHHTAPSSTRGKTRGPATALDLVDRIEEIRQQMFAAAESLQFETAAQLRDELKRLQAGASGSKSVPLNQRPRPARRRSQSPRGRRRR